MAEVKTEFTGDAKSLETAAGNAQSAINGVLKMSGEAAGKLGELNQVMELGAKAQKAYAAASATVQGGTAAVTAAIKAQTVAFLSSPVAIFAAALVALGLAYSYVSSEAEKSVEIQKQKLSELKDATADAFKASVDLGRAASDYKTRAEVAAGTIDDLTAKHREETSALNSLAYQAQKTAKEQVDAAEAAAKAAKDGGASTRDLDRAVITARKNLEEQIATSGDARTELEKAQKAERAKKTATDALTAATKAKAEAEKGSAKSSKEKAEQDAKDAKALAENIARTNAIQKEWEGQIATIQGAIDATAALTDQVKTLSETEEDRIAREFRDTDTLLQAQISANKKLGISTQSLEDSRKMLREKTATKYKELAQTEVDAQKKADADRAKSAEDARDKIVSTFNDIAGSIGSIASEIGGRFEEALAETRSKIDELQGQIDALGDSTVDAADLSGSALVDAYKNGEVAAEDLNESQKKFIKQQLQAQKKALKEKEAAEKKAALVAFRIQQGVAIAQAIISTAQGVIGAFQLGPIAGAIAAVAIGAIGATQIALIASEKPSFAKGGFTDNMPTTGGNATLHPREAVLNQTGRAAFGDDAIQAANAGVPVGGSNRVSVVYKHKVYDYFMQDHLLLGGVLPRTIRKGDRVGRIGRGRRH